MTVISQGNETNAQLSLRIVVIGAGLAGLAAAYALKRAGHDVTIVEKKKDKSLSVGVTQSPPNMTKILYRWGLKPILDQMAEKCASLVIHDGEKGDLIGIMQYDEDFLRDQLVEYLFIRTEALENVLQQEVNNERIDFVSANVVDLQNSPKVARLLLDDGRILSADFVICADGYDSAFKHVVTGAEDKKRDSKAKTHLAMTLILPMEVVLQEEILRPLVKSPKLWNVWVGPGFILHANVSDGGKFVSATMTSDYNRDIFPGDQTWNIRPLEYWGIDVDVFEPRLRKLLSLTKFVFSRVFLARPILDDLVCKDSKVVLVGDAAHPILPGGNQHRGLAIEEAETLRCIFSRIRHRDQIPDFLAAYEEIRQPRTAYVIEYESGMHTMLKMPNGPEQDERNAMLKQAMAAGDWDHMDEDNFRAIFGEELDQYSHDATEQVEDWWTKWGAVISKNATKREEADHRKLKRSYSCEQVTQTQRSLL